MTTSATDGHVLKKVILHGDYAPMHAIIPKKLLQILPLMVNRHASISRSDELIKLVTDSDFRIIARPIDIAFPDINRVMPKTITHIASINRDELLHLFLEAASFADNETRRVILRFIMS
jgi:DNA polymerase III sliding clamp (beta) subunit (PCNA family)